MTTAQKEIVDPFEPYYFKHETETICGIEVTPITDQYVEIYPTVVDRFFTRYYYTKPGLEFLPYQVLFHSNRICLICLAPEHPAFKAEIISLTYDIGNSDRSKNSVKGKGKKGGMVLQPDSTLALLTTNDGKTYKIPSCIRGKLVEVNIDLIKEPQRLKTAAEGEAYIAVILPKPEHCDEIKSRLYTQTQYENHLVHLAKKKITEHESEIEEKLLKGSEEENEDEDEAKEAVVE